MSPAKALRLALAQAGEELLGAAILTGTVEEARSTVPQMADLIAPGALVMLLQGSGRSRGLAILDAGALTAVIEALTTGRISAGDPPSDPRMPTATDAFLSGRFLTRIAGGFADYLGVLPDSAWAGDYAATEQVRDVRSLPLLLEDVAFRVISAPLDFDAGARQGTLRLVLPRGVAAAQPKALPAPEMPAEDRAEPASPAVHTEETLNALLLGEATLDAILHRQRVPLSALLGWRSGDLVSFPAHAISNVALIDAVGTRVATTHLGQASGQRAVKLLKTDALARGGLSHLAMAAARAAGSQPGPQEKIGPDTEGRDPDHVSAEPAKADADAMPDIAKLPVATD